MSKTWGLKVNVDCPKCGGTGSQNDWGMWPHLMECCVCKGTGKDQKSVPPKAVDDFFLRPEKAEFVCVCGKKEIILRPTPNQIPSGWISWNGSLVCSKCRYRVVDAAIMAASQKVMQLKELKEKK